MTKARIYKPARNALQSGKARTRRWYLEFDPAEGRSIEPLMGWTASTDTSAQVRLNFATQEDAVAFAEKQGLAYEVEDERAPKLQRKAYADNFSYHRQR